MVRAGNWIEDAHRSIRDIKKELAKLRGMRDSYVTRLRMLVQAQLDMLKLAEVEEETPDATLDLFEERLEALTAAARERVSAAGEGEAAAAEEAELTDESGAEPDSVPEIDRPLDLVDVPVPVDGGGDSGEDAGEGSFSLDDEEGDGGEEEDGEEERGF